MPGQNRYKKLTEHEQNLVTHLPNILESFHYVGKQQYVDNMRENGAKVFLDSGAFSAHTLGVSIDLPTYCDYIKRNMDILRIEDGAVMASVLDGIGDPLKTYRNQLAMEKLGAKPLPCFHYGEDSRYLDWYVKNYDYITIGGMVGKSSAALIKWLDRIWEEHLIDGSGRAKLKVHAFGITAIPIMERYPWHCMTEENHQVLTRKGWSSLKELTIGDEILCFDKGVDYWDKISNIFVYPVENEEITHLSNRTFEANVTMNHKWAVLHKNKKDWLFKRTEELKQGVLIPRVGEYNGPIEKTYSDELVELMGWFWTDGTIKQRKSRGYLKNSVVIYQSQSANPEKVERIRNVLIRSNEEYCEHTSYKDDGRIEVAFELYGKLRDILLEISPDKHIHYEWLWSLTKDQLKLFVEVSVLADGTDGRLKRGYSFSLLQKSKKSIQQFRVASLLCGIPTSEYHQSNGYTGVNSSTVYNVYPEQLEKNQVKYSGNLWCVSVPSNAFYTKCNDCIYVTGNSVDSSSWIQSAAFGGIVTAKHGALQVSSKSPARHNAGAHVSTMTPTECDYLYKMLEDSGFTYERLSTVYESRAAYNLWSFGVINTLMNANKSETFRLKIQELF